MLRALTRPLLAMMVMAGVAGGPIDSDDDRASSCDHSCLVSFDGSDLAFCAGVGSAAIAVVEPPVDAPARHDLVDAITPRLPSAAPASRAILADAPKTSPPA
jgi:hypothetical protein